MFFSEAVLGGEEDVGDDELHATLMKHRESIQDWMLCLQRKVGVLTEGPDPDSESNSESGKSLPHNEEDKQKQISVTVETLRQIADEIVNEWNSLPAKPSTIYNDWKHSSQRSSQEIRDAWVAVKGDVRDKSVTIWAKINEYHVNFGKLEDISRDEARKEWDISRENVDTVRRDVDDNEFLGYVFDELDTIQESVAKDVADWSPKTEDAIKASSNPYEAGDQVIRFTEKMMALYISRHGCEEIKDAVNMFYKKVKEACSQLELHFDPYDPIFEMKRCCLQAMSRIENFMNDCLDSKSSSDSEIKGARSVQSKRPVAKSVRFAQHVDFKDPDPDERKWVEPDNVDLDEVAHTQARNKALRKHVESLEPTLDANDTTDARKSAIDAESDADAALIVARQASLDADAIESTETEAKMKAMEASKATWAAANVAREASEKAADAAELAIDASRRAIAATQQVANIEKQYYDPSSRKKQKHKNNAEDEKRDQELEAMMHSIAASDAAKQAAYALGEAKRHAQDVANIRASTHQTFGGARKAKHKRKIHNIPPKPTKYYINNT
jgi:hypothetical protein